MRELAGAVHLARLPSTLVTVATLNGARLRPFELSITVENTFIKVAFVFGRIREDLVSVTVALIMDPLASVLGLSTLVELDSKTVSDSFDLCPKFFINQRNIVDDPRTRRLDIKNSFLRLQILCWFLNLLPFLRVDLGLGSRSFGSDHLLG